MSYRWCHWGRNESDRCHPTGSAPTITTQAEDFFFSFLKEKKKKVSLNFNFSLLGFSVCLWKIKDLPLNALTLLLNWKTPVPCVLLSLLKVQAHLSQVCFRFVHSLMDERGGRPLKPHLSVGGAWLPALSPVRWFVKTGSRGDVDVSRDESSNFARNNTVNLGFFPK